MRVLRLATFVLSSHLQLVAAVLDSVNIKHFHNHRKFYWIAIEFDCRTGQSSNEDA